MKNAFFVVLLGWSVCAAEGWVSLDTLETQSGTTGLKFVAGDIGRVLSVQRFEVPTQATGTVPIPAGVWWRKSSWPERVWAEVVPGMLLVGPGVLELKRGQGPQGHAQVDLEVLAFGTVTNQVALKVQLSSDLRTWRTVGSVAAEKPPPGEARFFRLIPEREGAANGSSMAD